MDTDTKLLNYMERRLITPRSFANVKEGIHNSLWIGQRIDGKDSR